MRRIGHRDTVQVQQPCSLEFESPNCSTHRILIPIKCVLNSILHCICVDTLSYNYDKVVQMGRIGHGDTVQVQQQCSPEFKSPHCPTLAHRLPQASTLTTLRCYTNHLNMVHDYNLLPGTSHEGREPLISPMSESRGTLYPF